jgi:hypothetical protein
VNEPDRFSIFLGKSGLPTYNPETGNWIVYNVEIYSFREVAAWLEGENRLPVEARL